MLLYFLFAYPCCPNFCPFCIYLTLFTWNLSYLSSFFLLTFTFFLVSLIPYFIFSLDTSADIPPPPWGRVFSNIYTLEMINNRRQGGHLSSKLWDRWLTQKVRMQVTRNPESNRWQTQQGSNCNRCAKVQEVWSAWSASVLFYTSYIADACRWM